MKRGDIVGVKDGDKGTTHWLYHSDFMNSSGNLIPTDIPFGFSDVGIILKSRVNLGMYPYATYHKILTPRGIGWIHEGWGYLVQNSAVI